MFLVKLKPVNILLKILLISSYFHHCLPFKPFNTKRSKAPEIWLVSFQQTDSFEDIPADNQFRHSSDFENEFVSKFNKTDYIIQDDTREVVFICQAKYPVTWNVPHIKHVANLPYEMFITDTLRMTEFLKQAPKNKYFRTSLKIRLAGYVRDVFSANFTCELPNTHKVQHKSFPDYTSSSIHLYYAEAQQQIEHFGDTIQINVSKYNIPDALTIPCRPAIPTLQVKLEKEVIFSKNSVTNNKTKRIWKDVPNFTYDPKYGFTLQIIKESLFGLYRCCILDQGNNCEGSSNEQVVFFNVTLNTLKFPKQTIEDVKFEPNMNLKGDALLMYSDHIFGKNVKSRKFPTSVYHEPDLWCCSGVDNDPPVIYSRPCSNPLQCDIIKKSLTYNVMSNEDYGYNYVIYEHLSRDPEDCVSTLFYHANSVVFCKGENVQFGDYLIKLFSEDLIPVTGRRDRLKRLDIWTFESASSETAVNISRRIFMTVGHSIGKDEEGDYGLKAIEFVRSSEEQFTEVALDYWDEEKQNFKTANLAFAKSVQTQNVAEYNRDVFYVGEPLIPVCLGWLSFYSHGAYLKLVFTNGTSLILNLNEQEEPPKYSLYFSDGLSTEIYYDDGKLFEHKFGQQVLANKDMVAFECWMPQWNTEKWDKLKFELDILEPTKPVFLETGDENETNIYFYLGNKNQTLVWRIVGGSPEPKIDVSVDGKKFFKGDLARMDQNYRKCNVFEKFSLTVERDGVDDSTGVVSVKIVFIKATHDVQGVYKCKVHNIGGTVTKSFKVIVIENRSFVCVIIMALTISLLFVVVVVLLIYKYWKLKIRS